MTAVMFKYITQLMLNTIQLNEMYVHYEIELSFHLNRILYSIHFHFAHFRRNISDIP